MIISTTHSCQARDNVNQLYFWVEVDLHDFNNNTESDQESRKSDKDWPLEYYHIGKKNALELAQMLTVTCLDQQKP